MVTTGTGTRRTVPLGAIPPYGESEELVGNVSECASGCTVAALELRASPGVRVEGEIEVGDVRVDGRPAAWWSSADDWNATEEDNRVVRPLGTATNGDLRLLLSLRGLYPVELTPAWVPQTVPAILPTARRDGLGLDVTGVDGSDRPASSAGRVTLIPTMPARSALVDLDAVSRGAEITHDTHAEVWLVDDAELVTAVTTSLRERGIVVAEVRRLPTVRQTHQDTVATWSLALGVVVGPIVLLLALLVLLVLAVTGWRERARDLAILRLNGAGRRTTRRLAVWAHCRPSCSPSPPASGPAWSVRRWRCPTSRSSRPGRRCPSSTRRSRGRRSGMSRQRASCCCRLLLPSRAALSPAGLTWNA